MNTHNVSQSVRHANIVLNAHAASVTMLIERGADAETLTKAVQELRDAIARSLVCVEAAAQPMNDWHCQHCGALAEPTGFRHSDYCLDCIAAMLRGKGEERRAKDAAKRAAWLRSQQKLKAVATALDMEVR